MAASKRKFTFNALSLLLGFSAATFLFPDSGGLSGFSYTDLKQEFLRIKNYEAELRAYESELQDKADKLTSLIDSLQLPDETELADDNSDSHQLGVGGGEEDLAIDPHNKNKEHVGKISIRSSASVNKIAAQLERLKAIPIGAPVAGSVSSNYGTRRSPFSGKHHFHAGLDISAPIGADVLAPANGIVTRAEWYGAYGKMIVIEHGFGLQTSYAHLSDFNIKEGDRVVRGQLIGKVGNTGRTTGPHLHYEIRLNGKHLNPDRFVMIAKEVKELGTDI